MDVSSSRDQRSVRILFAAAFTAIAPLFFPSNAHAYNPFSHEQITRSALAYLKTDPGALAETAVWLNPSDMHGFLEETLVRATVDTDYKSDIWFTAWFHDPFTGAKSGDSVTMFTRMTHFVNVNVRGHFWEYDGYGYRYSSRSGSDNYINTISLRIMGDLSRSFGGNNPAFPAHGFNLGALRYGYKASNREWNSMYYGENSASDAVFPPAYVPAEVAFAELQTQPRAEKDMTESWNENLPLVTGAFSSTRLNRHYWRGEVQGLPKNLDLLGITLHMAQDVTIPQHAEGTVDLCHQELEDLSDRLNCGSNTTPSNKAYDDGSYGADAFLGCRRLYDAMLVRALRSSHAFLDPRNSMSITDRIVAMATESARWQWGDPRKSADFMGTILPDGYEITGESCNDILRYAAVKRQMKIQFNMAVALSATLIELAAHQYEPRHRALLQRVLPSELFNFFKLKFF